MDWTLEVVVVPVADVDRAKRFYADQVGFDVTVDRQISETFRVVQLTPRGSGCAIGLVTEHSSMEPGSMQGLQLVVADVRTAHAELAGRGVPVGEVQFFGPAGPRPAEDDDDLDYTGFVFFSDPDGNGWAVQQMDARS